MPPTAKTSEGELPQTPISHDEAGMSTELQSLAAGSGVCTGVGVGTCVVVGVGVEVGSVTGPFVAAGVGVDSAAGVDVGVAIGTGPGSPPPQASPDPIIKTSSTIA